MSRLPGGGLIDRATTLPFRFDGRDHSGFAGDTLASALLASGEKLFGRSFKYHRPRGLLSAGPEEPNALMELRAGARREPNVPATMIELYAGLEAASQNRFPSLRFDLMALNNLVSPLIPAGFYYKTFMWPASWWERLYEPLIRRAAGLGRASGAPDPDHYERGNLFCDVLVIGGGPAGLSAALAAGRQGARVVLCEADPLLGGRLLSESGEIDGMPHAAWVADAEAALRDCDDVKILCRTTVFASYDHGVYAALERVADHKPQPDAREPRQRAWRIVAKRAVLASGAIERLPTFGGNDRPGVMLAGAVRTYLNRYAVAPGGRVVVLTSGDDGWRTVADLSRRGVRVSAIVDRRAEISAELLALAKQADAAVHLGGRVVGTHGDPALHGVDVALPSGGTRYISADVLAVSGGWNPAIHLACHLGARPVWHEDRAAFLADAPPPGMTVVGAAAGAADNGRIWIIPGARQKAFVDLQHDVTTDDIALAHREGFSAVEHMKRYTTHGMATDQGKSAGVAGMAAMAELTGRTMAETGTTLFRPPYTPVAIGALAGHHRGKDFRPTRYPPAHGWAKRNGASFVESGPWLRAEFFPQAGETDWLATVNREVTAVRGDAGFCDVSTLGKIELVGPDVGAFLDFLYINTFSSLPVGRARYGVMLREDGFVFDDGTVARLAADRWIMTTTTANAPRVLQHMEFVHQVLRPEPRVAFVSVTDRWAQFAIAGPRSREVVAALLDNRPDISDESFPFMAAGTFSVLGGVAARLFRISFSGERAYELGVPASRAEALAERIATQGAVPYGLEALNVMRIEKGHPAGGELNGQTTAHDLGMGRMMSSRKDFIGRALSRRPALRDPLRPTLVGLRPLDRAARPRAGAHLLPTDAANSIENDQGWVTSVAFSPSLGHWIGLAMLANGPARNGERLRAFDPVRDGDVAVEVVAPCFIDPAGARLRG